MMRNPYEVIGVSKTATQDEIRNAYRKLAKKHHPDLNPGNKANEDKFKEITQAYETIGTAENRTKYDNGEFDEAAHSQQRNRQYSSHTQGGPGARYSSSFDFDDDLLSSLFGGSARSQGRSRQSPFAMAGEDLNYKLDVDFKEAILGTEKTLSLPNGKHFQTKIPPGIKSGQKLRFTGKGGMGSGGGPSGDLFVEISVKESSEFIRNEENIESEIGISIADALLGGEVQVSTVDGNILLNIPAHSNSGSKLRIRGKGVPSNKGTRGDHIVKLKILLPDPPDPKLDSLIKEWHESRKTTEAQV